MRHYKYAEDTVKVEAGNCLIVVKDNLYDHHGRYVTSIQIIPDKYPDSNKVIRVGGCANIRCITLKSKPKRRK